MKKEYIQKLFNDIDIRVIYSNELYEVREWNDLLFYVYYKKAKIYIKPFEYKGYQCPSFRDNTLYQNILDKKFIEKGVSYKDFDLYKLSNFIQRYIFQLEMHIKCISYEKEFYDKKSLRFILKNTIKNLDKTYISFFTDMSNLSNSQVKPILEKYKLIYEEFNNILKNIIFEIKKYQKKLKRDLLKLRFNILSKNRIQEIFEIIKYHNSLITSQYWHEYCFYWFQNITHTYYSKKGS